MINCFAYRERVNDDGSTSADCRCYEIMLCKYKECPLYETHESHKIRADKAEVRNKKLGIVKYVRSYEYANEKTGG